MTRPSQTELELHYARVLRRHFQPLARCRFRPLHPPDPDVLATRKGIRIGIEVTELHGNSALRRIESEQDRVFERAHELWKRSSFPPVDVGLHWRPSHRPTKSQRCLADEIVSIIAANLPVNSRRVVLDPTDPSAVHFDHSAIEHMEIYPAAITDDPFWLSARRWTGGHATAALLQKAIDKKKLKLAGYRTLLSERWLLLVHNGARPSSGFDIGEEVGTYPFTSNFDRVLLLSLTKTRVRELRVAAAE